MASLPSLVHDVEPVTHNGKLRRGFHTTLTAERQLLKRPRTLVTAPIRLSSRLWPKGPHIREPTTIPTRGRETSRRHMRALHLPCLRELTKNLLHIWHPSFCGCHPEPGSGGQLGRVNRYRRTAADEATALNLLLCQGSEHTGSRQKHPCPPGRPPGSVGRR